MNSQGRKFKYIEDAAPATLSALSINQETGVSKSVLVEGRIYEGPEGDTEAAYQALASNAHFGTDLTLWGVRLEESDPALYGLRPDTVSGKQFWERQAPSFNEE